MRAAAWFAKESGGIYGAPRIQAALLAEGERVSRKRVARLTRELGIEGVTRRRFKTGTTRRDAKARPAPDLVNRNFSAEGPDQLWVADITQVPTWEGWLYLTSLAFGKRCREAGVVQSMGSVGDAYDNGMCESFFATLECELLDRRKFPTVAGARREVFSFIEGFYNTRRLHSALGYESPVNFEKLNHAA